MIFNAPLVSLLASASSQALSVPPPPAPAPQPEEAIAATQPLPEEPKPEEIEGALPPAKRPDLKPAKRELSHSEPQAAPPEPVTLAAVPAPLLPQAPAKPQQMPDVAMLAARVEQDEPEAPLPKMEPARQPECGRAMQALARVVGPDPTPATVAASDPALPAAPEASEEVAAVAEAALEPTQAARVATSETARAEAIAAPAQPQIASPVAPIRLASLDLQAAAPMLLAQAAQPSLPMPSEQAAEAAEQEQDQGTTPEDALLEGRRRPGVQQRELPDAVSQDNPGAVRAPPPEAFPTDQIPVPDRWRLIETLGVVKERWFDPYNQNTYKGDRPICVRSEEEDRHRKEQGRPPCRTPKFLKLKGEEWFFQVNAISDTVLEPRTFPIPVGVQTTSNPGSIDVFGKNDSLVVAQTFIFGAALTKGSTAFKPPDVEYRIALAFNANYVDVSERRVLFVEPSKGTDRFDNFLGVQEFFVDYHLRNVSDRYDFDSIRVGVQPFQFDFRGFLFNDQQLGVRLFGNRDNNRFQYNLAAIWRLEKDTNSGLNDVTQVPRDDYILHANVFRQDFPVVGLTSTASLTYNINRERGEIQIDDNGFPVRPALIGNLRSRSYDVFYLGYGVDGRFGRLNLSAQAYGAFGWDRKNIFTGRTGHIRSYFFAAEPSYDVDFLRFRGALLLASGDGKPFNNVEGGFDAIFENPIFAGADTSYWIRQTIPFAGGGRAVSINGRNGILNSLRSSKEQGQSNFNNPGTILLGAGVDADLTPEFRLSANANHLWFHKTQVLEALRTEGSIPNSIGFDVSLAAIYRPKFTQNIVFRASAAVLQPSKGFKDLFFNSDRDKRYYSILLNAILTY